jgi:hypothetical protein
MSLQRRSLDDLPLAAYTTGSAPDDADVEELPPDPGYTSVPAASSSTADRVAQAHAADSAAAQVESAPRRRMPSLKLPSFRRSKDALEHAAPFQPVATPVHEATAFQAVRPDLAPPPAPATQAAQRPAASMHAPSPPAPMQASPALVSPTLAAAALPALPLTLRPLPSAAEGATVQPGSRLPLPAPPVTRPARPLARDPRELVRDPRVLAGGVIAIGIALLGFSLLGGGGPASGSSGPNGSHNPVGAQPTTPILGNATVELTAGTTGTFTLGGVTGAGPAVSSRISATWSDAGGQTLGISGLASQGVRTTDVNFVLTWNMVINGAAVTFTSQARECTIGMAVGPTAVHGSFVCKKLTSPDRKHVIDLRGTYST